MSKSKYIKGSQLHMWTSKLEYATKKCGLYIGKRFYSREFLGHWKVSTLVSMLTHEPCYSYYERAKVEEK